jgi:uncharacterized NAD(P)/FAD-binding protein YdhS
LNAPAIEMSAFSDRPFHLVEWAGAHGFPLDGSAFVPRALYRQYLSDVLVAARRDAGPLSGVSWIREEAVALARQARGDGPPFVLGFAGGGHLEAADVVFAIGPPPGRVPWVTDDKLEGHPGLVEDPWAHGALGRIRPEARVLLLGTGLTMVDVSLSLGLETDCRTLHARSRRGLLPLEHRPGPVDPWLGSLEGATTARELVRALRVAAEKVEFAGGDWRSVVAGVRQQVPELWSGLPPAEQRRLVRLGLRHWEVHRHRMAPQVASAFAQLRHSGRLDVAQGRLLSLEPRRRVLRARIGHARDDEVLEVDAVVNCTGATGGYANSSRLISHLVRAGLAEDDRGLGLKVDALGDLVGADGRADDGLHVIGWARRGRLLESTAIPELRCQAESLARRIARVEP